MSIVAAATLFGPLAFLNATTAFEIRAQDTRALELDFAALAIRPVDLEESGWRHAGAFVEKLDSEASIVAGYRNDGTTPDDVRKLLISFGWQRMYMNTLSRIESGAEAPSQRVRSYITEYTTADGAATGFAFLEDEGAIPSASDVAGSTSIGEQSEITSDSGISAIDGRPFHSLDLTFRLGRFVAGVTYIDYRSTIGETPDLAVVETIAGVLERRLLDPTSEEPGFGTKIARLADGEFVVATYDDAYYRIGGTDIPLADESPAATTRRVQSYADATDVYQLWQGIDVGSADGLLYGVTSLKFVDDEVASAWMDELPALLSANPFYADLQPVELSGSQANQTIAMRYVSGGGSPDSPRAMLVAIRVGSTVMRVHVVPQGQLSNVPLEPVLALANVGSECLSGNACAELTRLPDGLTIGGLEATPVARLSRWWAANV